MFAKFIFTFYIKLIFMLKVKFAFLFVVNSVEYKNLIQFLFSYFFKFCFFMILLNEKQALIF